MFEHTDGQTDGQTDTLVTSTEIHDLENIDVLPIFFNFLKNLIKINFKTFFLVCSFQKYPC